MKGLERKKETPAKICDLSKRKKYLTNDILIKCFCFRSSRLFGRGSGVGGGGGGGGMGGVFEDCR